MKEKIYYVGKLQLTEYNAKYPSGELRRTITLPKDVVYIKIVKKPKEQQSNKQMEGRMEMNPNEQIAKAIHYPRCWDTMAYPTLASALWEMIDIEGCLLYTSPSPRDRQRSRMPSSA